LNLDLLAIAAHPDDVELTCGGTLLKMAELGYKTGILDLTAGEMGTRGSPKIRAKEAAKAGQLLRVSWRDTLGAPDSDVHASRKYKLRLAGVIRQPAIPTITMPPRWATRGASSLD
jgi:N-acetylglucosamine malate deacetylase 1